MAGPPIAPMLLDGRSHVAPEDGVIQGVER
jgi:hypothetical protein